MTAASPDTSPRRTAPLKRLPIWSWPIIVIVAVLLIAFIVLSALPITTDPVIAPDKYGAGADQAAPSWTGLQRDWPTASGTGEFNPKLANLGYQLFFDPVLSGDNQRACATCHNPDYAFSDPNPQSLTPDGKPGRRHAPTLWNVAFSPTLFWDGRASSLEEQVKIVIADPNELDQDPDKLVQEIKAVPGYETQFKELFPDGVTVDNIASALSAFERTLISDGAAFDAYASGQNMDALTSQQRRGLALFRSAGTRCFECHGAPNFSDGNFAVVGVPDQDRIDKGKAGQRFAFKTPTLRNVALRAAFFHNGSYTNLDDVVKFYAADSQDFKLAVLDRRVAGFTLTKSEQHDLATFLYALTDETIPEKYWTVNYVDKTGRVLIPSSAPSGLMLPPSAPPNPARQALAEISAGPHDRPDCQKFAGSKVLSVKAGESIQQAVDCSTTGDTVEVEPGVYHERVVIDQNGITLRGKAEEPSACPLRAADGTFPSGDAAPKWPILDGDIDHVGKFDLTDGVIASGNDFKMEYFIVRNYSGNCVLVEGAKNVTLRHIYANDSGLYGVYPVHSTGVLLECNVVTNVHDAGVYVGQTRDIVMRNNLAYDNVAGMEIENSVNAEAYGNEAWGNTGGLLIFALPNLTSKVSRDMKIHDNYVHDNNRPKQDAAPGSLVSLVPEGTGMFVMGNDNGEFTHNRLENNDSFGIGLVSMYQAFTPEKLAAAGLGPLPENNHIHDNTYAGNGSKPDPAVTKAGLPGGDVLWDTYGVDNTFDESNATMFPPVLPSQHSPVFVQRALTNLWSLLSKLL